MDLLGDTNVPMMMVNSPDDLITNPHLVESGFWQEMEHPTEGTLRMASPPMNLSKTPASIRRLPPRLGEHTGEVLKEAGYSDEQVGAMLAAGQARDITQEQG